MEGFNQVQVEQVPFGVLQHDLSSIMPTASEIGHIWSSYFMETMARCFLKSAVLQCQDQDMLPIFQETLDICNEMIGALEGIFHSINHPIPIAFSDSDINFNAKRLFSDSFKLKYIRLMKKFSLLNYSYALSISTRSDFRNFFNWCIDNCQKIHTKATDVLLGKGVLLKSPSIPIPKSVEFVGSNDYFGSLFFGENRPLNALEIGHLVALMETKQLIEVFNTGYRQVVKSNDVKSFLEQAKGIADVQLKKLGEFLENEELPQPARTDNYVSDSTENPYSDKLIQFHITVSTGYIIGEYGRSLTTTSRKDLAINYSAFMAKLLMQAKNGAEIMIKNGWLEQVAQTVDHSKLN